MKDNYPKNIILKAFKEIEKLFNSISDEIRKIILRYGIKYNSPFKNFNKNLLSEIKNVIKTLREKQVRIIINSIKSGWSASNNKIDELLAGYLKRIDYNINDSAFKNIQKAEILGIDIIPDWSNYNLPQLDAFLNRKKNGLSLSDRIWNLTKGAEEMIYNTLESGIMEGRSASEMSRILRQTLKEPEKLFRRIRDKKTGELVLSKPAKNYHPGQGYYRSSYKNALRLCATETNMAYRFAEMERYNQIPFITGYEVVLSNSHKINDICDNMQGSYPKNFAFIGWHPNCLCHTRTLMLSDDEFIKYMKTGKISSSNYVKELNPEVKNYIKSNMDNFKNMKTVPYWFQQNNKLINSTKM